MTLPDCPPQSAPDHDKSEHPLARKVTMPYKHKPAEVHHVQSGPGVYPPPEAVADFSGVATTPAANHATMLNDMAFELRKLMAIAEETAAFADKAAKDLAKFQLETLPQAMEQAGLSLFRTEDGFIVEVKEDVQCSIPKEDLQRRMQCFEWLRTAGHGAVIKELYAVDVRTLDDETKQDLARYLDETLGVSFERKEDVHPSTLKSLIKELLGAGTNLPPAFSVHQFKKAGLKAPKGTK